MQMVQFSTMPTSSEPDADKAKQGKKQETERKYTKEPLSAPKALLKRSSCFFFTSFFRGLMTSVQKTGTKACSWDLASWRRVSRMTKVVCFLGFALFQ